MAAPDALRLLISACSRRLDLSLVTESGQSIDDLSLSTHISLPSSTSSEPLLLPKATPTRLLSPDGTPYDLQSLVLFWLNRDAPLADYMRKSTALGARPIGIQLKRSVLEILEGRRQPNEKEVLPEEGGPTAGVQTGATTDGNAVDPSPRPTKKVKYQTNKEDLLLVKGILALHEPKQLSDRRKILRGAKQTDFSSVKTLVSDRIKTARDELSRSSKSGSVAAPAENQPRKRMDPIIIVSPSSSAIITMQNVKQFLEEGIFQHVQPNASRSEDVVSVLHKRHMGGNAAAQAAASAAAQGKRLSTSSSGGVRTARYLVVDSIEALTKFGEDAWDRVVCVMTTGQKWQFAPYKWPEPKELFHHVKGVYFQFTNSPNNDKVKGWNVTMLKIDPTKRYIDKSVVAEFWRHLEMFMEKNKPYLSF